ncbi:hypothetical protein HG535_0A07790 [Zygotorulaspora mrakii]|uniref:Major facilitator superfamily (MFS) profile domain-containing protein n=1 Tax=Zygotorulaspora mrakii TaxID=42260 RepID=A0A7H9AX02_ZYGMR|nr:uncharacterized protein HG535_0A07790 [Zygotorulaspora mrakii]QLG70836.1 hypothetical protein HG535_0A07790 [Zygotorulaspora mrakii]
MSKPSECRRVDSNELPREEKSEIYKNQTLTRQKESSWQDPDYFDSAWKEYTFVISGMVAQLLNQAGSTMTLPLINVLSKELNTQEHSESWLMASFPLVSGSFILVSGRLGDIYGLKKTLLFGYIILIVWSLICGLTNYSNSGKFFIVSRAFQGFGISFILPNVLGIVGNIYKPETKRKNMVISLIGMCAPLGATLGTFFSGLIVVKSERNWPWTFYAYTIAATINLFISYSVIPNNIPTNTHGFSMDWIGAAIGISGLILFNFVWNQAPIVGWDVGYIIALLIVSVFLIIGFFVFELNGVKVPLLPEEVSCNRANIMILGSMFLGWGSFGIWTFYYFQIVLNLRQYSPVWAGGTYFMFAIWGCIAALTVAFSIKRVGPAVLLLFSLIAFDCGSIILSVTPVHETYFRSCLGAMIILSFGMDLSFPAASIILSDELPMQYQGMAGSLVNTVVNYSMSLFLGIGGTVERQINKTGLELLKGYRAALYFAIGSASLGVLISGIFVMERIWKHNRVKKASQQSDSWGTD